MPTDRITTSVPVDDAQLRYQSLMEHVELIRGGIKDFPGAAGLKSLSAHYIKMANSLFRNFNQALVKVTDEKKKLAARHMMVDKLATEWEIIFQLTANAKLLGLYLNTTSNFSWLNALTKTAQKDLDLGGWDFIIVPRLTQRYALTQFRYATEFAALDIPISSLNGAWEWGVLWHELASRKIKELKKETPSIFEVPGITTKNNDGHEHASELIDQLMSKLQKDEAVGSPLLNHIRKLFKTPPPPNWSQDWVEEIFEDACSVLTFGEVFIPVLENILNRTHTPLDKRHPNPEIRIRMARRLLNPDVMALDDGQEQIEKEVARHIKKLIETKLKLPILSPIQETDIHRELRTIMKKYASLDASSVETEALKARLNERVSSDPEYAGKIYSDPPENVESWAEVGSKDYQQMLGMSLSESDFLGITEHQSDQFGSMSIMVHGTIHEFYHTFLNHK